MVSVAATHSVHCGMKVPSDTKEINGRGYVPITLNKQPGFAHLCSRGRASNRQINTNPLIVPEQEQRVAWTGVWA